MDLYHYHSGLSIVKKISNRFHLSVQVFIATLAILQTVCLGHVTRAIPSSKSRVNEFNIESKLYSVLVLIKTNRFRFLFSVYLLLSVGMSLLVSCFHRGHLYLGFLFKQRLIALVVFTLRDSIILCICGPHIRSRRKLRCYPRSICSTLQTLWRFK